MEPEKLKTCAEAVGKKLLYSESAEVCTFGRWPIIIENGDKIAYDPEHNDAQMAELLKWLIDARGRMEWVDPYEEVARIIDAVYRGQTLNQAVIEAVCEVKK